MTETRPYIVLDLDIVEMLRIRDRLEEIEVDREIHWMRRAALVPVAVTAGRPRSGLMPKYSHG